MSKAGSSKTLLSVLNDSVDKQKSGGSKNVKFDESAPSESYDRLSSYKNQSNVLQYRQLPSMPPLRKATTNFTEMSSPQIMEKNEENVSESVPERSGSEERESTSARDLSRYDEQTLKALRLHKGLTSNEL